MSKRRAQDEAAARPPPPPTAAATRSLDDAQDEYEAREELQRRADDPEMRAFIEQARAAARALHEQFAASRAPGI